MNVLVLGGGVIGCTVAYYLAQAGATVTLLERDTCARHASGAAAGILDPFHIERPVRNWAEASLNLFGPVCAQIKEVTGIDPLYDPHIRKISISYEPANEPLEEGLEKLSSREALALVPQLNPDIDHALLYPPVPCLDAKRYTRGLSKLIASLGVHVLENTQVDRLLIQQEKVVGVQAGDKTFYSEQVVDCTGSWAGSLTPLATSIRPARGQIIVIQTPPGWLSQVVYAPGDTYLGPKLDGRILLGSTVEDAGYDESVTVEGALGILARTTKAVPAIAQFPVLTCWGGLRPRSRDDLPVIGPHATLENLWIATGHFRNGVILSLITGQELAPWILQNIPSSLLLKDTLRSVS
ncbi:MAG: FAD-dependent oxidoreductase [Gloeobacterales cyanobacterium]